MSVHKLLFFLCFFPIFFFSQPADGCHIRMTQKFVFYFIALHAFTSPLSSGHIWAVARVHSTAWCTFYIPSSLFQLYLWLIFFLPESATSWLGPFFAFTKISTPLALALALTLGQDLMKIVSMNFHCFCRWHEWALSRLSPDFKSSLHSARLVS